MQAAWAPGKGVKESEFKDCWDVEVGVAFIPWERVPDDISDLAEGGIIDEDSLPDHLRCKTIICLSFLFQVDVPISLLLHNPLFLRYD